MRYEFNFGSLQTGLPRRPADGTGAFRIAVLGDFSGRANRGELETGGELAQRKPIKLDTDNIDAVIRSFGAVLQLPAGADGIGIALKPPSLDDLHPDALYETVEVFSELSALRLRLENPKTFRAARELSASLGAPHASPEPPRGKRARGTAVRVDAKLSDFARLIGRPTVAHGATTPVDELVRRAVAPYWVEAEDPDRERFTAAVDRALSATMRDVLHHPDFQALEAAWRSLDLLVRRVETSTRLQIVLYDISAEELAADLSATDAMEDTGLYRLLVEQPALDALQGPLSALIGNFTFEMTPPHAELLGRMARIAAAARAPFIAAIGPDCVSTRIEDLHPLVADAWDALRALPETSFVALTVPRFLLRTPYGSKTEPIESFAFEEFDAHVGLKALLWGNSAILAAVLLAEEFQRHGNPLKLGSILSVDELPYFFYIDSDGDQIVLPCTERLLTERKSTHVSQQNFIPVLAIKNRPEVRLAGFRSLAGNDLAGAWTPFEKPKANQAASIAPISEEEDPTDMATGKPNESTNEAASSPESENGPAPPSMLMALPESAPVPASEDGAVQSGDTDLDALLAELESAGTAAAPPEEAMDPELAALLRDL
jgi:type VI secretion system protein ImpC